MKFNRILLKLSGESLAGSQGQGIDPGRLASYASQIREAVALGVQVGIVVGGGNIFRGVAGAAKGFDRVTGDQMGNSGADNLNSDLHAFSSSIFPTELSP